jgi:Domain of unknown function (DUF3372)
MNDRVRMDTLSLATAALGQSPSFWQAGSDMLRSKSFDSNSYDSGDWFNRIDWSGRESTFGSGTPPNASDQAKAYMRPLLGDPRLKPQAADIQTAAARAEDLLRLRFSSPLLRLGSARLIEDRVSFPQGGPDQPAGTIVMAIDDRHGADLDPRYDGLVAVFNAASTSATESIGSLAGQAYQLDPVQATGADPIVRQATYTSATGSFTVPARTVAVFVAPQAHPAPLGAPPGAKPPVQSPVDRRIAIRRATLRVDHKRHVKLRVRCGPSAGERCRGTVQLVWTGKELLARRSFSIPAGRTTTVTLRLDRAHFRRLAGGKVLHVSAILLTRGSDGVLRRAEQRRLAIRR